MEASWPHTYRYGEVQVDRASVRTASSPHRVV